MSESFYFSILAELATFLESIVCGSLASALSTAETSAKVTNPNPRERFVTGSFITTASCTVPYCLKCFLSFSAITDMEVSNRYTSVTRREQLQLTLVSRKIQSTDKDFSAYRAKIIRHQRTKLYGSNNTGRLALLNQLVL
jgi:hypothetical protein